MASPPQSRRAESAGEVWTTRRLQKWINDYLSARDVDSPRVAADMLLAHVLGCERMRLYMEVDRPATPDELNHLRELIKRAADHEPVQHLVGEAWFFSMQFEVNASTLIPRPSTETLIEHILQHHRVKPTLDAPLIGDIGTGSGCIAIALAKNIDNARIIATDISSDALELARRNANRHNLAERIEFHHGDGLSPLTQSPGDERFDYLCSNPPYISNQEFQQLARNVRDYEPPLALRGGKDGLDLLRPLIASAPPLLRQGGRLVLEIPHHSKDTVVGLAESEHELTNVHVLKDHEAYWRVLVGEKT